MIKKLDKLVIKAFIGPFIATFFITLVVLVLQFFWLYIDDIVGKGLDLFTIGKFILYVTATLVPLALPIAVLFSSIMIFGRLGETFELVAIKSAGISLLRFMQPILILSIIICGVAFLFNNNIIPVTELKMQTMKYDIIMSKPAFDIKEGVFYDKIEGYVIKIGKKEKDNKTIRNVIIYEKNYGLQDNIIVANSGEMKVTPDKHSLEFNLKDGWRYEEQNGSGIHTDFIRMGFKEYKKIFDLSSFTMNKTSDSAFKNNYRMLSVRQLEMQINLLERNSDYFKDKTRQDIAPTLNFIGDLDTGWAKLSAPVKKIHSIKDIIPDSVRTTVDEGAISKVNMVKLSLDMNANEYEAKRKEIRLHLIEWHRKFSMAAACLVLFLIGAPLGSIIRKGGLGLPLLFAIIFFVIFFLLNNFGEKLVKEDVLQPVAGMWMATFILVPIGLFLTWKAMQDSQLFNKEAYYRLFRRLRTLISKK